MSIEREILEYLNNNKGKRVVWNRGTRIGFLGLPDFKHYKYQTLANRSSELKRNGYIKETNGNYFITQRGQDFLHKNTRQNLKIFESERGEKDQKDLLLLYDIPEDKRSERNWFRRQLVKFHFVMIQRSVWVGPSPLPKDFLDYLKIVGLKDTIKTFKLEKGYTTKK